MRGIIKELTGGTRRSLGRTDEVVAEVLAKPILFRHLVAAFDSGDEVIRMRAADAIEKISAQRPTLLCPHKKKLLTLAVTPGEVSEQQEIRWHLALIFPRLELTSPERDAVVDILFDYLRDKSSIVRTHAMQSLADLAAAEPKLKSRILPILEKLTQTGTPAMRARGRKLLAGL